MRLDGCPCCAPTSAKREARVWVLARALCYGNRPPPHFIPKIRHALRVERRKARAKLGRALAATQAELDAVKVELEQLRAAAPAPTPVPAPEPGADWIDDPENPCPLRPVGRCCSCGGARLHGDGSCCAHPGIAR